MKLTFRKSTLPLNKLRKMKLDAINGKKNKLLASYYWEMFPENLEEDIEKMKHFHLFCLSIVDDLFKDNFNTNEDGVIKYDKYKKDENDKIVIEKIKQMMEVILQKK